MIALVFIFLAILIIAALFARNPMGTSCAKSPARGAASGSLITGLVLIGVGVVFLLDRFGLVNAEHIWNFWPLFFVVPGLINLTSPGSLADRVWGGFLVLFGSVLIL